ncbi:hypothetical protein PRZ48_012969 [Zasmidium cellare]|uniref:SnoaL-like domain-containing protein n=1 Tax=Zasmidium cellare TaxID=395010 RepID=A0ABR0E3B6_ZASCE|nr:hypothetical protein PRZ48_012969 [Zasmidium cellare]
MESLHAKDSIHTLLHTLAYAEDDLDREALLSLFLPNTPFTLDLSSHLASLPPIDSTPQQLWESAYQHLAGFTATQHMLGNILITFEGEGAGGRGAGERDGAWDLGG